MRVLRAAVLAFLLALAAAPSAHAAPPANDNRAQAIAVTPPATVSGSTADSTLEADEPPACQPLRGSVFYSFRASSAQRMVVRLRASGDLDATVDVFLRTRSQLTPVACEISDRNGNAALEFAAQAGQTYLVRVGQRANSEPGGFRLDVFAPEPPPRGPGAPLPARGASGVLDSLQHTRDAYAYRMRAGTPYRLNVAAGPCVTLRVYAPGTVNFDRSSPVRSASCDGYLLFTPGAGEGGRYSLVVEAQARRKRSQRYHLQAAPAGGDDISPGLALPNLTAVHGSLAGTHVDTTDLYRFSVSRRSALDLTLRFDGTGRAGMLLLDDRGERRGRGEFEISRRLSPGRYFLAVRTRNGGAGRYVLRRELRTITRTTTTVDGKRRAQSTPGQTVRIAAAVAPGAAGPVTFTIQHFDPIAGWLFFREVAARAAGGNATIAFTPPAEGRWRARAAFGGTKIAAPSDSGYATLLVAPPLAAPG
jgi:hypothetical protein